jgi:metal-responsive CopG/Arc/MetJ family transcriptional regulator
MLHYKNKEERKKAQREAMRRYINSPKGKATKKKYIAGHLKQIYKYHSDYMRLKRVEAKSNRLCIRCFSKPAKPGYVQCAACLKRFQNG